MHDHFGRAVHQDEELFGSKRSVCVLLGVLAEDRQTLHVNTFLIQRDDGVLSTRARVENRDGRGLLRILSHGGSLPPFRDRRT